LAILGPFAPKEWLNYHRSLHLLGLPAEAIDTYVEYGTEIALVSSPTTRTTIYRYGGAVSHIPDEATAAGHRDAVYVTHPIACTGG
jgi:hypothetical protein